MPQAGQKFGENEIFTPQLVHKVADERREEEEEGQ